MERLLWLDGQILLWIQEHLRFEPLNAVMRAVTGLGNAGLVWIALTVTLLIFRRTRRAGVACALALVFSLLLTNLALKNWVRRPRPFAELETLTLLIGQPSEYSFPSGHASSSFAAGWAMFRTLPRRWGIPALALAVLISLSRLYVGVHYPTDVLGGAVVGIAAASLALRLLRRKFATEAHDAGFSKNS